MQREPAGQSASGARWHRAYSGDFEYEYEYEYEYDPNDPYGIDGGQPQTAQRALAPGNARSSSGRTARGRGFMNE